jgi:hypothetical protein
VKETTVAAFAMATLSETRPNGRRNQLFSTGQDKIKSVAKRGEGRGAEGNPSRSKVALAKLEAEKISTGKNGLRLLVGEKFEGEEKRKASLLLKKNGAERNRKGKTTKGGAQVRMGIGKKGKLVKRGGRAKVFGEAKERGAGSLEAGGEAGTGEEAGSGEREGARREKGSREGWRERGHRRRKRGDKHENRGKKREVGAIRKRRSKKGVLKGMTTTKEKNASKLLTTKTPRDPTKKASCEDTLLAISKDNDVASILASRSIGKPNRAAAAGEKSQMNFSLLNLTEEADALNGDEEIIAGVGEGTIEAAESANAFNGAGTRVISGL